MARIFPSALEFEKFGHRVGDGRGFVLPMGLVEVDAVGLQPLQTFFHLVADRRGLQAFIDLLFGRAGLDAFFVAMEEELAFLAIPNHAAFRGNDGLVAAALERPADKLLGTSVAVDRRGVEEVDAGIEGRLNGGDGEFFIGPPHIQPPIAQAPKPIADTSMSEEPSLR